MEIKEIILTIATILTIIVVVLAPGPASAGSEGTVNITCTPGYLALTVSPGDVAFGTVGLGETNQTTGDAINATNTGTVTGDMNIKAFNTNDWTLTYTNATGGLSGEQFFLNENETGNYGIWTPINLTYSTLATGVAVDGSTLFDLKIGVSGNTAATAAQTTNVTLQIVAAA